MGADMPGGNGNDVWKLATEQFKGYMEARIEGLNDRIKDALDQIDSNNKCICEVKDSVNKIQTQLEISKAVQKLKQTIWGAIGGLIASLLIALFKELLKTSIFGK